MNSNSGSGLSRPRVGGTPTATAGKFHPPSAPMSGTRVRRGVTPRSASRIKASAVQPSKPKFSVEQQLDIINRLQTGNYKKGVGISQFYEEFNCNADSSKLTCKQNLFASFASVDNHPPLASSTRNYGRGGSVESLLSVSSSVTSSAHSYSTTLTDADITVLETPQERAIAIEVGEDSKLEHVKEFDKLVSVIQQYFKALEDLSDLQCKVRFAQLLPEQKMVTFFRSLNRTQQIIQKFLNGNATENMHLFMPSHPPKGSKQGPTLHCDVERHSEVVQAFYKLSGILDKLDMFLKQGEQTDFKLEAKLDLFKESVDRLENIIQSQEKYSQNVNDLIKKSEILSLADSDGSAHWERKPEFLDALP